MRVSHRSVAVAAAVVLTVAPFGVAPVSAHDVPDTIDLPAGFAGEGVATAGRTYYAGSLADGRIARGSIRTGSTEVFVANPLTPVSVGLKADRRHDLLWVAGGPSGQAAVYSLDDGSPVGAVTLTTAQSFVNDVTVTRNAAYFTNSFAPEIYRVPVSRRGEVGDAETIALSGPAAEFVEGFNINGIAATRDGRTLIAVNSAKGELYTIDAATGSSTLIDLGGASVVSGDGIFLDGRTLYVLQNGVFGGVPNQIAVIELDRSLTSGEVVDTITSPLFETATTLALSGDVIVAVNAQFAGAPIDEQAELVLIEYDD
jgi:sugar lactone lactonase YvrE